MSDKAPNYTNEQIAVLARGYDGDADEATRKAQIVALGDEIGKSAASVRAKLTHMGIYVPLTKAPAGKAVVRKSQLVQAIADQLDADVDVVGSLEKATKNTLIRVYQALATK